MAAIVGEAGLAEAERRALSFARRFEDEFVRQGGRRRSLQETLSEGWRLLETMPAIPLYYYVSRHLVRPGILGWQDNVRDIHLSRYLDVEHR